ncbi:MAG: IS3 family transposase [Thermonemataceae bacterium]
MKKTLVSRSHRLSLNRQLSLLGLSKGSFYYEPKGESEENEQILNWLDRFHLQEPTAGVKTMQVLLEEQGIRAGYERVRRLMRKAHIWPIYPKRSLSQLGVKKYIYPYLLKNLSIKYPNQVWQIDITYLPMKRGFMYLTAIIDVYSRMIVGWGLSNTLETTASLAVIKQAIQEYGVPQTLNSDQGAQFTSEAYVSLLKHHQIQISMDGRGRALDNVYIERFWRTLKYQYVYLYPAQDGISLYRGLQQWIQKYNHRKHQTTQQKPINMFHRSTNTSTTKLLKTV